MNCLLIATTAAYNFPSSYPSLDQKVTIDGAFLQDPVILAAIAKVNSAITDKALLSIRPSTYRPLTPNSPLYNDNPIANCYWGSNQCTTSTKPSIKPDIVTCPGENTWGITFDDGPSQNIVNGINTDDSTALKNLLDSNRVKATFFVIGANVLQFPNVLKSIHEAGHQIALHTWTHHPLTSLTNEQIVAEIIYNEAIVFNVTGVIPTMMRPPYGDIDDRVRAILQALGYQVILWSRDSGDTTQANQTVSARQQVVNTITSWFRPGPSFIGLEHDISTFTTSAAITALSQFFSLNPRPLNPVPIGTCLGLPFYANATENAVPATNTPTVGTNPVPTIASNPRSKNSDSYGDARRYSVILSILATLL